jgi:hypothetical protein
MKKYLYAGILLTALTSLGANLITQDEALVSSVLAELKFESVPNKTGLIGAPPKFKITKQTLAYLEKLSKEGKVVEIQGNGSLKILPAAK